MTTSYTGRVAESTEDLRAQVHYLTAKCHADGNLTFDGHRKTVEELDNESRCRSLCARIERAVAECPLEEVTGLLEMYELLYRIGYGQQSSQNIAYGQTPSQNVGYGTQPLQDFLSYHRNRVYAAWRAGNRNIQESQIYRLLKKSINGRSFAQTMLKNWLKILLKHNRFPNVTTHENYQRLSLIMRENIDGVIASQPLLSKLACGKTGKDLKKEWYESNHVDAISTLSTPLLNSYRNFIASLFPSSLAWI